MRLGRLLAALLTLALLLARARAGKVVIFIALLASHNSALRHSRIRFRHLGLRVGRGLCHILPLRVFFGCTTEIADQHIAILNFLGERRQRGILTQSLDLGLLTHPVGFFALLSLSLLTTLAFRTHTRKELVVLGVVRSETVTAGLVQLVQVLRQRRALRQ